jgi:hypothetical protein
MLEQFQKRIEKSQKDIKSISLAHKYMTSHFLGLIHAFQLKKVAGYKHKLVLWAQPCVTISVKFVILF